MLARRSKKHEGSRRKADSLDLFLFVPLRSFVPSCLVFSSLRLRVSAVNPNSELQETQYGCQTYRL
jgi:hypothetical protein